MDNYSDIKTVHEMASSVTTEEKITRRNFAKKAVGLGFLSSLTLLNLPQAAQAWLDGGFAERDDLGDALKSLFMTYDSTSPYPHKFNETITKAHLRGLEFFTLKGLEKEYAEHYVTTMRPIFKMVGNIVKQKGPDKGLYVMFERTTCSYQLFERINIKEGERSFPCPYKGSLENCKKYLGTFTIEWKDVCNTWCIPTWKGFAKDLGIKITVHTGEECSVKLA